MKSNNRIKSAAKKALYGDITKIVYLGGSVTAGYMPGSVTEYKNYARLSFDFFCEKTRNNSNLYLNLGFSGASSLLGLSLTDRFLKTYRPDIVFVEYAINDSIDNESMLAYEGLIRKLLAIESRPAVIPLHVPNSEFFTAESYMSPIDDHYGLETISASDNLKKLIDERKIKWLDYSSDNGHPNKWGHKFIAEQISKYFSRIWKEKFIPELKCDIEPYYSNEYSCYRNIDFENIRDLYMSGFVFDGKGELFPCGITSTGERQSTVSFTEKFRILFIIFQQSNNVNCGELQVYIDNNYTENISGYSVHGWNNPCMKIICNNDTETFHDVKLVMKNSDGKRFIHIYGMGAC